MVPMLDEQLNVADFFLEARLREGRGERIALIHDRQGQPVQRLTYAEVAEHANRFAYAFRQLGLEPEQRVLIAVEDGPDFVGAFFGALKLGAVVVMVNPELSTAEAEYFLGYSRAKLAVVGASAVQTFSTVAHGASLLSRLLVVGQASATSDKALRFSDVAAGTCPTIVTFPSHRDDPALWLFSGGTTGKPKAVVQTHGAFVNTTRLYAQGVLGYTESDVTLSVPKLYFGYATGSNLLFPMAVGATSIVFPERVTAERLFALIAQHRPTILINVPTMVGKMLDAPGAAAQDLSSLRFSTSAGEGLPESLHRRWLECFGVELLDGLGTAEMWHVFVTNRPGQSRPGTLGRVVPGFEIRVCDDEGKAVPDGEVGLLWVRGQSRGLGYVQQHDASCRAFVGEWYASSDMVRRAADGTFTYCGRGDDMLKVAGKWLAPNEVEGCLVMHPAVVECAVVGILDASGLVKPYAFVRTRETRPELGEELKTWVRERLSPYKAPREVVQVEDLPRTHLGKVDRGKLRHSVETGAEAPAGRRLRILGAGPGGLYTALLAKKRHPSWDVQVYERNRPDDTFGWGVVFSDDTLSNFEVADAESYAAITHRFVRWTDIDTYARDECIRSTGHGFCGIARVTLLQLLQQRCLELGVGLHFEHEASHTDFPDADVIVAADGINSRTRSVLASAFEPDVCPGSAPFIWLGADRKLDSFTFIFRDSEHGTFQVHAYPFSDDKSTFIVETNEPTLARSGLEALPIEESVAYLERLFAAELGGARLLTNKSQWVRFRRVKNARWHAGNVVLIGDAAHTAHFSIGSGTKLAMEDAIALVDALDAESDVPTALLAYEQARWVDGAKLQLTADVSQRWFENAAVMYRTMEPLQLLASMMTRSKRVTHENLRLRDPALVARLDRWFAVTNGNPATAPVPPPMFTPFTLRDLRLDNRVVVSPMCQYSAVDGVVNDFHLVHLGSRALGGAGLVIAEMTDVSADARITPGCAGMYRPEHVGAWKRIVDFVHQNSRAKIGMQLAHAGRKGATKRPWEGREDAPLTEGAWELVAPSSIPYRAGSQVPREMTRADMARVGEDFVRATRMTEAAGFDWLELHMAHGYLLSSFISPLSNRRTDEYGGSLSNRMRFPLDLFDRVRAAWPQHKPISVRISACDWVQGGLDIEAAIEVSRLLKEHGCDLIDVSSGQTSPDAKPEYGRMFQAPFANLIRHGVGIPTMAVGAIQNWDHVNTIIASGRADLCALARPHLADPYLTLHAAADQGWNVPWPVQYTAAMPRPE